MDDRNRTGNPGTPSRQYLDFEKPIFDLEAKIAELKQVASVQNISVDEEVQRLNEKAKKLRHEIYSKLTAWQQVQLARHPMRPYTLDYIKEMSSEFVELHGDRAFADDPAVVGGFLMVDDKRVMVIGHQKGRNTKENLYRNFGMPHPEGYRKALRLMKLAEKFRIPVVTLIDTPGAYPGIGAEERGQFEAIARNLREMSRLMVPILSIVIGEGGSGGALALGVGDRILMLEHAIYSVISPEGCAAILWKDQEKVKDAAEALKLTSKHLQDLGIIDRVISEPGGGAHRDPKAMAAELRRIIYEELNYLAHLDPETLIERRRKKYQAIGFYKEDSP
ncbi:MAG: acetyl-CoA carboxylase carboxyltransferase subunit alpha [Candidatus Latescibacteria bacterium]|nr:acetyl-CoA carboxylase carboxyltransferase subunit alpha [Candidatus Latescibacterota bacterium]NIM21027.1 acetyl-CoA carboxylase carboxyltransferase subunit alpha [Candidatus Latescibacterota bacterium]NIM65162.1 acetyl-CoA carboxylase carboxyltransferase subunit alpha [Candidatus Latescibacterota bacterium]NIO01677.1 acetyl-CoA carboxylase carboxyltransferase subunit alpha [Candidatus Latescibacterota bacterium]NIO28194.1 acetyl-CoA carboxylase carboxyltransferase subunit alpha [Candidatus